MNLTYVPPLSFSLFFYFFELIFPFFFGSSHEYVVCQKDKYGPILLSEFAGSAQSLGGAVLVNPWYPHQHSLPQQ